MDDFRRWTFGVARLVAMEFLRTRRRDRHVFGDEALRLLAVASEESEDAFEAERRALKDFLRKLPEDQHTLMNRTAHELELMRRYSEGVASLEETQELESLIVKDASGRHYWPLSVSAMGYSSESQCVGCKGRQYAVWGI